MTTYDAIPYPSYSHAATNPAKLRAISKLFGLDAPDVSTSSVLEIGCASGGNLLPLAEVYPDATFLGVDLSKKQIDTASGLAKALGLANVSFRAESVLDSDFGEQKFDYILVHGVFSWVDANVQDRILDLVGEVLSDTGIAYISYNTLPGWNGVKTVRDMMIYHTSSFSDPKKKVTEARNMLAFAAKNILADADPYKRMLETEISTLQGTSDNYLLHDHLEAVNDPCYLHEFMERATKRGLAYLGDANLPSMYLGNQAEDAAVALSGLNDTVRQEQYMDFITNRRFRSTLLVKATEKINRQIDVGRLSGVRILPLYRSTTADVTAMRGKLTELGLVSGKQPGPTAKITGKWPSNAFLELLLASPATLSVGELVELTAKSCKEKITDDVHALAASQVLSWIFKGVVDVSVSQSLHGSTTDKPVALSVVLNSAASGRLVTNAYHNSIRLTDDQRIMIVHMNGESDFEALVRHAKKHAEAGELTFAANGKTMTKKDEKFDQVVRQYVSSQIDSFMRSGLLKM